MFYLKEQADKMIRTEKRSEVGPSANNKGSNNPKHRIPETRTTLNTNGSIASGGKTSGNK